MNGGIEEGVRGLEKGIAYEPNTFEEELDRGAVSR